MKKYLMILCLFFGLTSILKADDTCGGLAPPFQGTIVSLSMGQNVNNLNELKILRSVTVNGDGHLKTVVYPMIYVPDSSVPSGQRLVVCFGSEVWRITNVNANSQYYDYTLYISDFASVNPDGFYADCNLYEGLYPGSGYDSGPSFSNVSVQYTRVR